jgi:hypothetical protein
LEFEPLLVVKGQALTMHCIVEELGRPEAKVYRWMRGTHVQPDVRTFNWTAFSVSLEHRANFSCQAVNEAGLGPAATVNIDVFGIKIEFNNPLYHIIFTLRFSHHRQCRVSSSTFQSRSGSDKTLHHNAFFGRRWSSPGVYKKKTLQKVRLYSHYRNKESFYKYVTTVR